MRRFRSPPQVPEPSSTKDTGASTAGSGAARREVGGRARPPGRGGQGCQEGAEERGRLRPEAARRRPEARAPARKLVSAAAGGPRSSRLGHARSCTLLSEPRRSWDEGRAGRVSGAGARGLWVRGPRAEGRASQAEGRPVRGRRGTDPASAGPLPRRPRPRQPSTAQTNSNSARSDRAASLPTAHLRRAALQYLPSGVPPHWEAPSLVCSRHRLSECSTPPSGLLGPKRLQSFLGSRLPRVLAGLGGPDGPR